MDVGDPGMDGGGGELENSILFEYIEFEVSERNSHRTIPGARPLMQKNYNKSIKRSVGQMHR